MKCIVYFFNIFSQKYLIPNYDSSNYVFQIEESALEHSKRWRNY